MTKPGPGERPEHPEHAQVVVVGAGLSGVGAACRLLQAGREPVVLEAREALGGTWDLFRYPGVRSDSDMFTLGYPFHPWKDPRTIADGPSILDYVRETAHRFGVTDRVRLRTRLVAADWDGAAARWTLTTEHTAQDGRVTRGRLSTPFLYLCSGYYRYDGGYAPDLPGLSRFGGRVVHPQQWPEDLDVTGRRVVVLGSGATAVTLVPGLAARGAAHVTMLQRSPSHVVSVASRDAVVERARALLPGRAGDQLARWKNILVALGFYRFCRRAPRLAAGFIRRRAARELGPGVPVDPHFRPRYDPWDQRLCLVPDGDLFAALRSERADVVTDEVAGFTAGSVVLASGRTLEADVLVTATGFRVQLLGGASLTVDGERVDPAETFVHRGVMLSGVPNAAICIGYTNASWTLRADLCSRYVCRLLDHMDRRGWAVAVPEAPPGLDPVPFLELGSGYVRRADGVLPRQGSRRPWRVRPNYVRDRLEMSLGDITAGMRFSPATRPEKESSGGVSASAPPPPPRVGR